MTSNTFKNSSPKRMGYAAYGKIPHLPGSRLGPGDHHISAQQAACFFSPKRPNDRVVVQEKVDGSCVAAWRQGGLVVALGRDGREAAASHFIGRQQWASFVAAHQARFLAALREGERVVGEWLGVAHGTRYALSHEPFVAFDVMDGPQGRLCWGDLRDRLALGDFVAPALLHEGDPIPLTEALERLGHHGHHGATDQAEGAIWRLERGGRVHLIAKFVRASKQDGCFLPENTGQPYIFNASPGA